jgi:hypothetical protein
MVFNLYRVPRVVLQPHNQMYLIFDAVTLRKLSEYEKDFTYT